MPPLLPAQLDVFSAEVIPLLQRRGLFRTEYTGRTLREHYGLPLPASAFEDPTKRVELHEFNCTGIPARMIAAMLRGNEPVNVGRRPMYLGLLLDSNLHGALPSAARYPGLAQAAD